MKLVGESGVEPTMARLAAPLGYRKPAEPMRRVDPPWHAGIAATLRAALSNQREPERAIGDAVQRLHAID